MESGIAGGARHFTLELEVGLVGIDVAPPFIHLTSARLPEFGPPAPSNAKLARALGLEERDLLSGHDFAEAASCGTRFLFVPVRDRATLARAHAVTGPWDEALRDYWTQQIFIFCRDPELPGSHVRARMFAPDFGIVEDPATGSAAAAFAGYLAKREPAGKRTLRWRVEQGFEMGRPSLMYVEADKDGNEVTAVRVGGTAVTMSEGTLRHVPATQ